MVSLSSLVSQPNPDHAAVLEAANTQLGGSTTNLDTLHLKLVALLQLERYNDARALFDRVGQPLKDRASLEWAYTLYKEKSHDAVAAAAKGSSRAHRHVLAQAAYTLEDFERAHRTYMDLLANTPEDELLDVKVNVLASNAQALFAGRGSTLSPAEARRLHDDASEVYYNTACTNIASGNLVEAEQQLRKSQDLLNARQDLTEDDKKADMLSIRVQQVCVLDRLGRRDEALKLLSSIQESGVSDAALGYITAFDSAALNSSTNAYTARQEIERQASQSNTSTALFDFQKQTIDRSRFTSYLTTHQPNAIHKAADRILKASSQPTSDIKVNTLSVLDAAATAGLQPAKKAIKSLLPLVAQRPDDVGLVLVLIQLYASTKDLAHAITTLESFNARQDKSASPESLSVRFAPGLVALGAALYEARNQTEKRRVELGKAVTFWRKQQEQEPSMAQSSTALADLFKSAGYALLSSPEIRDQRLAAEVFGALHERDPDDKYAAAGLCASIDERTPQLGSKAEKLVKSIDVDALLRAGIATAPILKSKTKAKSKAKSKSKSKSKPSSKTSIKSQGPKPANQESKNKTPKQPASTTKPAEKEQRPQRRIKPSRMPKNFDPAKKPDPERWLPLRDRSSYRPAKGKNKKLAARLRREMASQGAVGGGGGGGGGAAGSATGSGVESVGGSRSGTPVATAAANAKKKKAKGKR